MIAPIEDYFKKYDEAAKDSELLQTFWSVWGKDRRTACINMRSYDKYQECGYEQEPIFDKYGWLRNGIPEESIETVKVFGDEPLITSVECAQLPNGKWVSGSHWFLSDCGGVTGCSIWGKQYSSRVDALTAVLSSIMQKIKNSKAKKDKSYLPDVVSAMDGIRQLSLF